MFGSGGSLVEFGSGGSLVEFGSRGSLVVFGSGGSLVVFGSGGSLVVFVRCVLVGKLRFVFVSWLFSFVGNSCFILEMNIKQKCRTRRKLQVKR